jgi:hypothetical protein
MFGLKLVIVHISKDDAYDDNNNFIKVTYQAPISRSHLK